MYVFYVIDFQNYLRTQTGNNTTVNIIIFTVDYLLRVQVRLQSKTVCCKSVLNNQTKVGNG